MLSLQITSEASVYQAISLVNHLMRGRAFTESDRQCVFISVSEVIRNVLDHAGGKGLFFCEMTGDEFSFTCLDYGSGIANLPAVLNGSYESPSGLGVGLVSVQRLMDDLSITTSKEGTKIIGCKRERRTRSNPVKPGFIPGSNRSWNCS